MTVTLLLATVQHLPQPRLLLPVALENLVETVLNAARRRAHRSAQPLGCLLNGGCRVAVVVGTVSDQNQGTHTRVTA